MQYLQSFGTYFLVINSIAFLVRGIDKYKARKNYWRISERTLLLLMVIGGFLGGLLGMQAFHHKMIKGSFLRKFWLIVLFWIGLAILWGVKYL